MFCFLFSLFSYSMPASDFAQLKNQVNQASFSSEKLSVLQLSAQNTTFTADQIKSLISGISFASDQLEALEILAPKLEDPSRSFTILEAFTFSSSKSEAQEILSRAAPKMSLKEKQAAEAEKKRLAEENERLAKEKERVEKAKEEEERMRLEKEQEQQRRTKEEKKEKRLEREAGPIFQWAGRCPKRKEDCVRFNPELFSPIVSQRKNKPDHALILEISGPGLLNISAEMGKKYNCKRRRVNRQSQRQRFDKSISLSPGRNRINITEIIPDWKREYAEIHVSKGIYESSIHLDNWKRCRE